MTTPLRSLIDSGTKLWLDSIDPELTIKNRELGATGATSNPIIVSDLINTGRFDDILSSYFRAGHSDEEVAWLTTDHLVKQAQAIFQPVWEETQGNDGYVSFELDPLLEDNELAPSHDERVKRYIELGKQWASGHTNRMIKIPATAAGLDAVEELAAAGITLNVTLIFSKRQYEAARDAVWRGAQRRKDGLDGFKSVYSIFVSRVDVYTDKRVPNLSDAAQGQVGIVNVKRLWQNNQNFWADKGLKLQQEIIFASTGTKKPEDPADKYVGAPGSPRRHRRQGRPGRPGTNPHGRRHRQVRRPPQGPAQPHQHQTPIPRRRLTRRPIPTTKRPRPKDAAFLLYIHVSSPRHCVVFLCFILAQTICRSVPNHR